MQILFFECSFLVTRTLAHRLRTVIASCVLLLFPPSSCSLCYLCPCPSPSPPHHPVAVSGAVCHCAGWQDSSRRTLRHPAAVLFAPLSGFLSFCRWHNLYPVLIFLLLITGAPPQCLLRLHSSSPSHVFGQFCDCPSSAVSHAANKLRILSLAQSQGTFSN